MASKPSKYGGINSRRRGVPSSEPERIERRQFVEQMQAMATSGKLDAPPETISVEELLQKTKPIDKSMDFSAALAMAEASLKEPEPEEEVVEEDAPYVPGVFVPERWMIDLNTCLYPSARLIVFHGIGQNHTFYRSWGDKFRQINVALHAVCMPGRCHRLNEPPCGLLDAANFVVKVIETYHANGLEDDRSKVQWTQLPTFVYGHCMGAEIAFEVAKAFNIQYHDKTHPNKSFLIDHLVISSALPPHLLSVRNKDRYEKRWSVQSDSDLMDRAAALGGIPQILRNKHRRDFLRLFIPTIRQDYYAYEKYDYIPMVRKAVDDRGSVDCPVTVFGTKDDKFEDSELVAQWDQITNYGVKGDGLNHTYFFAVGGHSWLNIPYKEDILLHFLLQICSGVSENGIQVRMPTWEDEDGDDEYVREVETFYG